MITTTTVNRLIQPNLEGIPKSLRDHLQWICWKCVPSRNKPGTFTKVPIQASSGYPASTIDPRHWSTFDAAVSCYRHGKCDGIGLVTTTDDGLLLIDFDNCRNPDTGELSDFARRWVNDLGSYCEVSPSGTGLHVIIEADTPTPYEDEKVVCRNRELELEVYVSARYFCVTGVGPDGPCRPVAPRQEVVDQFFRECQLIRKQSHSGPVESAPPDVNIEQILHKIASSKNASKVIALLQGDRTAYHDDWSAADQALCNSLAFWCDRDVSLMDKIFRCSKLLREKWDVVHSQDGATYGEMTIQNAIDNCRQTYGWDDRNRRRRQVPREQNSESSSLSMMHTSNGDGSPPSIDVDGLVAEEKFWGEEATDKKNTELFIEFYGASLLYCHTWKSWLIYDGTRWKRDDVGAVIKLAHKVSEYWFGKLPQLMDEAQQKACLKHAQRSASTRGIEAFLSQAQSLVPVQIDELNPNPWLLNTPDGTINLKSGQLQRHERRDRITTLCTTRFSPDVQSLTWNQFLESTFAQHPDVIPYLQRLIGASLVGRVYDHILPVFWGSGANGKSTLLNAILDTLGSDYAMQIDPSVLMQTDSDRHPTERADLYGKRFVAATETEANKRLNESLVKSLTGGDKIRARFLYKDFFEFDPSHTIVLCSNHKPRVYGDDYGIWRRLQLVPFVETFRGSSADPKLAEKLLENRSGILAWMVRGCLDWQAQGLNPPETVVAATAEYRTESDVIGQFITSACQTEKSMQVKASAFYEAFEEWCRQNGEHPPNRKKAGTYLSERYEKVRNNGIWYRGIGLSDG